MGVYRAAARAFAVSLILAAPASARVYDVPRALGRALDVTRHQTSLDILLPGALALDFGRRVYAYGGGNRHSYSLSLAATKPCGANACFLAMFTAERGGAAPSFTRVRLRDGITGYLKGLTCGASCSPPAIWWRSGGVLYEIQARVPDPTTSGQRLRMVRAANAAIAGRPR